MNRRHSCTVTHCAEGSFEALVQAFKNRDFRFFAFSDLSYWVAMTFVQTGISFYVIMLLGLEKGFATTLLMVMIIFSCIFYVPIGLAAKRFGKKRIFTLGFAILIAALPMAIFGILPNAIVADIADIADADRNTAHCNFGGNRPYSWALLLSQVQRKTRDRKRGNTETGRIKV